MRANAPEVIQTSAMDCGPAVLASVLDGFGAGISYPRLREACQTDVDGTSIDTLEELANRFGLEAEQMMLPNDFVFYRRQPALYRHRDAAERAHSLRGRLAGAVRLRADHGSRLGDDPGCARIACSTCSISIRLTVPAEDWLEYAHSEEFLAALLAWAAVCSAWTTDQAQSLIADACQAFSMGSRWRDWTQPSACADRCLRASSKQRSSCAGYAHEQLLESPGLRGRRVLSGCPDRKAKTCSASRAP